MACSENDRLRAALGFDKWDKAGYAGSRVTVVLGEDFETIPSGHGGQVLRALLEFCAPKRVLYARMVSADGQALITQTIPAIVETGACVCGASLAPTGNDEEGSQYDAPLEAIADRCTLAMAGGYRSEGTFNIMTRSKYIDCIGAFYLDADTGKMTGMGYTGSEDEVDFCGPAYVWISTVSGGRELFSGNSAALPVQLAQRVRIQDFFIARTGKPLGQEGMYQFLQDCCKDLGTSGYDGKTGWGAPALHDPADIDIDKYRRWSIMNFADADEIAVWAKQDVEYAVNLGLMNGKGGNFDPKGPITREEAAAVAARLYRKLAGE